MHHRARYVAALGAVTLACLVAYILLTPDVRAPSPGMVIPRIEDDASTGEVPLVPGDAPPRALPQETIESTPPPVLVSYATSTYIAIEDSCAHDYSGDCIYGYIRIDGALSPVIPLRSGMVLNVDSTTTEDGAAWYKVMFNEWIRYPDRLTSGIFVRASDARAFEAVRAERSSTTVPTTTKHIIIDLSSQTLTAYEGDTLFLSATTSTGVKKTPTPRGTFMVYRKMPSRYMQGPIPGISEKEFDLPGVPWNLYFTKEGAIIHGAYWHKKFGQVWSNGCVNLPVETARTLYLWAEIGTTVTVRD